MSNENGFCMKMMPCAYGSSGAKIPDLSYEEQEAGFKDWEGKKVYVKSVKIDGFPYDSRKNVKHNISGLNEVVSFQSTICIGQKTFLQGNHGTSPSDFYYFGVDDTHVYVRVSAYHRETHSAKVILYYTCTDR